MACIPICEVMKATTLSIITLIIMSKGILYPSAHASTVITVMCSSFLFTYAGTSDFTVETSSITYIPSDPSRQADPVIPLRFSISRDNIALEGNETFNISLATSDMLMENEFIGAPVTVTIRDADGKKNIECTFCYKILVHMAESTL